MGPPGPIIGMPMVPGPMPGRPLGLPTMGAGCMKAPGAALGTIMYICVGWWEVGVAGGASVCGGGGQGSSGP